jgi:hypothetical protein
MNRRDFLKWTAAGAAAFSIPHPASCLESKPVFRDRGYYLLPVRMPTFGLDDWKQILDLAATGGTNVIIWWIAGGFRSKKFPLTWRWTKEHENVKADFGRELIAHAHRRGVQVLLGFTPFGYDGVNQYAIEHPELKATGPDGRPVEEFGIGCWGWNLCPAKAESQRFMREYAREMAFEFYPRADGLFIESSDYAICHCDQCGPKFFEHEFSFVREISDEVWARNPDATIVVYPHYFTGAKLRFTFGEGAAAKLPFDPRWTLFFTPHSAAIAPDLITKARGAWWWNEAPSRFNIAGIRDGAKKARDAKCTGYIPSLESYSYVMTRAEWGEQWLVGKRQVPFGLGWVPEGGNPYTTLPVRAISHVYGLLSRDPDLSDAELRTRLGLAFFGDARKPEPIDDLYTIFEILGTDRNWSVPAPLTTPGLVKDRAGHGRLDKAKRAQLREQLDAIRSIAARYADATNPGARELRDIARWFLEQWTPDYQALLQIEP